MKVTGKVAIKNELVGLLFTQRYITCKVVGRTEDNLYIWGDIDTGIHYMKLKVNGQTYFYEYN